MPASAVAAAEAYYQALRALVKRRLLIEAYKRAQAAAQARLDRGRASVRSAYRVQGDKRKK